MANSPDSSEARQCRLLTVGHSNHELEAFLDLLQTAGVTTVADVRSSPHSKWLPHFNRAELAEALRTRSIDYVFLGDLLGGRPGDDELYDDGRVNYEKVRATAFFQQGLEQLISGVRGQGADGRVQRIAVMCSEADPLDCHRGLMIAPALVERGIFPGHLLPDGSVESTAQVEERLLSETGRGKDFDGLFADQLSDEDRRQELAEAYREMARRKAYRVKPD